MAEAYEGTFKTTDNVELFECRWGVRGNPKAGIVLIHGYGDHCGRYEGLVTRLADRGYLVAAFDQRGHGRSEGRRGFIYSFDAYLDDLDLFINRLATTLGPRPLFLNGHSLGGLVAALHATTGDPLLKGVVLCSPALRISDSVSSFLQSMSGVMGLLFPWLPVLPVDATAISRDPAVIRAYMADPLVYHGRIRAQTGAEILRATSKARRLFPDIALPMLILHGTADRLCDVRGSQDLYERAASVDKTLKLYEGSYHELLNEPEKEAAVEAICDWLDARSA